MFMSPVKHAASQFPVRKNVTKKKRKKEKKKKERKRAARGWTDITVPGPVSFLSRSSIYYGCFLPE